MVMVKGFSRLWVVVFVGFVGGLCSSPARPSESGSQEEPPEHPLPFFVENLSQDTEMSVNLWVAVRGDGVMMACWGTGGHPSEYAILCRLREGAAWGLVERVDSGDEFTLAWDRGRGFWLVYTIRRFTESGSIQEDLFVRRYEPGRGWGERFFLSDSVEPQEYVTSPWVVVDGDGRAHVVWRYKHGSNFVIMAYRQWDGAGWGSMETIGAGLLNHVVRVTLGGEVWVVGEWEGLRCRTARRVGKEAWEVWTWDPGPGLVNGSLNLDLLEDGDVMVSWQGMKDPYRVAIMGMLKSRNWQPETLRAPARMGYYHTVYVGGDTVLLVWTEGVRETVWVYAGLWVRRQGLLREKNLVGYVRPHLPVPYFPVVWGDTVLIPFANDHEGNFEVYLIHLPLEVLRQPDERGG